MHTKNKKILIFFRLHYFFLAIIVVSISCSGPNLAENIDDDAVVAVVNSEDIVARDVKNEINFLMRQFEIEDLKELSPEEKLILKTDGLNRIIQNTLLNMEVVANGIILSQNEYRDALKKIKADYQEDTFVKYLEAENISLKLWERKLKNNMLLTKMISKVVNSDTLISDSQKMRYYETHQIEFRKGEQVRSLHIMVKSESEIKNIVKQLKSDKKDFSVLAQMYSLGPEGLQGGDLGYFEAGQMPEEFDGVFGLKVGQISDPIKTPYGHHLFKVIDKKPASQMTYDESNKIIHKNLLRKEQSKKFKKWMAKLKDRSDIEIKHGVLAKIYE